MPEILDKPMVVVLILNFRKAVDTLECVQSVLSSDYPFFEILVIDNHSEDGSADVISKKYPQLAFLRNPANYGYAEGNNVGVRWALDRGAKYVFVLNNDTTVQMNTISHLVAKAQSNPLAAILSPKVLFYDQPTTLNSCGTDMDWFRLRPRLGFCGQEDRGQYQKITRAKVFPGCALLLRSDFLLKEGLFDAGFFLLHEDADLCYRSLRKGYQNIFVSEAIIFHKVSATLSAYPVATQYYSTRNFLYLAERHACNIDRLRVFVGVLFYTVAHVLKFIFGGKHRRLEATGFFYGVRDYLCRRSGLFSRGLN